MAEAAVKIAKRLIISASESGEDPYLALLDYRNTPTQGMDTSPAQRMLNRRARTLLPMSSRLLEPQTVDSRFAKRRRRLRNSRSAWYHDRGAKDLNPLQEGDTVRIKPMVMGKKKWDQGTVLKRLDERSYEVDMPSGNLRRNRVYLRKSQEAPTPTQNPDTVAQEATPAPSVVPRAAPVSPAKDNASSAPSPGRAPSTPVMNTGRPLRASRNVLPRKFEDYVVN